MHTSPVRRAVRSFLPALGLAALATLAGCSMFSQKNPRFEPAPLTNYPAGISARIVWSTTVGSGGGYGFVPVVVGEAVYAATPNGSVAKLDLASGRMLWQGSAKTDLSAGVGSDGQVTAVATVGGEVVAFDDQGKEKWRARATSQVDMPPTVGDGVVVVRSSDYRIQAYDENTGKPMWNVQQPGPALALKTNMQMVLAQGLLISGLPSGKLIAINAHNGNVQWEGSVSSSEGATDLDRISDVVGTPLIRGPLLCAATYQGRIKCFDVSQGGRTIWEQRFSSATGLTADAQQVYASNQRGVVYAFSLADGHQVWKQDALRYRDLSGPAALSQAVAVGDYQGYVHFLSPLDGHLLGRLQIGGDAVRSPLLATSRGFLAQSGNGHLVMIGVN